MNFLELPVDNPQKYKRKQERKHYRHLNIMGEGRVKIKYLSGKIYNYTMQPLLPRCGTNADCRLAGEHCCQML